MKRDLDAQGAEVDLVALGGRRHVPGLRVAVVRGLEAREDLGGVDLEPGDVLGPRDRHLPGAVAVLAPRHAGVRAQVERDRLGDLTRLGEEDREAVLGVADLLRPTHALRVLDHLRDLVLHPAVLDVPLQMRHHDLEDLLAHVEGLGQPEPLEEAPVHADHGHRLQIAPLLGLHAFHGLAPLCQRVVGAVVVLDHLDDGLESPLERRGGEHVHDGLEGRPTLTADVLGDLREHALHRRHLDRVQPGDDDVDGHRTATLARGVPRVLGVVVGAAVHQHDPRVLEAGAAAAHEPRGTHAVEVVVGHDLQELALHVRLTPPGGAGHHGGAGGLGGRLRVVLLLAREAPRGRRGGAIGLGHVGLLALAGIGNEVGEGPVGTLFVNGRAVLLGLVVVHLCSMRHALLARHRVVFKSGEIRVFRCDFFNFSTFSRTTMPVCTSTFPATPKGLWDQIKYHKNAFLSI